MVTVVTVASRAAGRARLKAEPAAIFARIWDGGALKLRRLARASVSREKFAETKDKREKFSETKAYK
jgi:hypothetical protein